MPLAGALAPVVYLSCSVSLGALLKRRQKAEIEISAANDAVPRPDTPRRYIAPACALSTGGTCIRTCNTPHSATAAPIARLIDYAPRTRRDVSVSFSLRVSALF